MKIKIFGKKDFYVAVRHKFAFSHLMALLWMVFSIFVSIEWVRDLGLIVSTPAAVMMIAGIGYIPGYINAFMVSSLLLDRQPAFSEVNPNKELSMIIACRNEEKTIANTLGYIARQDYSGHICVFVVDNASTDRTYEAAMDAGGRLGIDLRVLKEEKPGKFNALNKALHSIETDYVITLDADTLLHQSAVRFLVSRMESVPADVCAVAGAVLTRNSRTSFITKLQEWDYFLGIASVKRMQGLYQGTLVAQGAFSLYRTEAVKLVGGWPDAIGEDIVLTWRFLNRKWRVFFEPFCIAFTEVPKTFKHLARQRSRWARGMIEALKVVKPWQQPLGFIQYLTGINLIMPYLDVVYTFVWIPGLVLALFGHYWVVGPATLFVLPLAITQNYILYRYQRHVFKTMGLKIRKNRGGFVAYVFLYQMLMSPMSVVGYLQELFSLKRIWK